MIDNKLIIKDTGLAEEIITSVGCIISDTFIKQSPKNNLIIVVWNQWIMN